MLESEIEYLCRHDDVIPFPAKVLDSTAYYFFALAPSVAFGTIEEVDSDVICGFEACECVVCMMSEK